MRLAGMGAALALLLTACAHTPLPEGWVAGAGRGCDPQPDRLRLAGTGLTLALALAGCAQLPASDARITGTALTQRPVLIPTQAVFEAALLHRQDEVTPPTVLARQRLDEAGMPPYAIRLPYRQSQIVPGGRYRLRASVSVDGHRLLATEREVPVLLDPGLRHADLLLQPLPPQAATAQATIALRETWWRLVQIVDEPPLGPPAEQAAPAHLLLHAEDGRLTGSGGCNRLAGQYRLEGGRISFTALSATLRLCLNGGQSETAFFDRLPRVASYRQQGRALELRGEDGTPLLHFEAEERGLPPLPAPPFAPAPFSP